MTKILIIAGAVLWFFVGHAYAQSSAMVQCRTGATAIVVPDYACDALLDGFRHLSIIKDHESRSVMECSEVVSRHFGNGNNRYGYLDHCQRMLNGEMIARLSRR
jgi:hypothetical protein